MEIEENQEESTFEFMDETKFQLMVEEYVLENEVNYIDGVLFMCDKYDREYEDIKKLISPNLKEKIKMSAIKEGYFKEESELPL